MAAVTISRQLGSLGSAIAQAAGQALGYRVFWRELINQAARQAGAPAAALAAIDDLGLLGICPSPKECLAYRQSVQQLMESLADEGRVIIVGRAGQVILGGRSDVVHVRIMAPAGVRAGRLAGQQGIPLGNAQAQVEASDMNRRKYLRRFYHVLWDNPELYDLVINTERVDIEAAAALICQAVAGRLRRFSQYVPSQQEKRVLELYKSTT